MRVLRLLLYTGCAFVLSLAGHTHAWADCQQIYERSRATTSLEQLRALYAEASHSADCDTNFRMHLGRRVAVTYVNTASTVLRSSGSSSAETMLLESLQYARLWQAPALLGDIAHNRKVYGEATRYYQEALDLIHDRQATSAPPAREVIQALFKKAETSRLLATEYVALSRSVRTRSFVPQQQALPITFVYDSAEFDHKGQEAVADLLRLLQEQQPQAITLIGHTDPQGSDAYNLQLSERRAEAVKGYLEREYRGRIHTAGHGKRELYQPDDPQKYTQEELYRLYRRVEIQFK
jgi:outer membrane protein OmpA-like peptidoglycan-associated protein